MSAVRRLNVQLRGTGDRAMVFAHGFGCDQRMWRHVAPHFETEFVTVLFDHMGSGLSDRSAYSTDKYPSLREYAQDLVELGREIPFEDAVLVGHSCGAMIGLLASIEAPRMFESLVLIAASPRYVDDLDYVGGFTQIQIDEVLRHLREDYADWSRSMAPVFMGNTDRPELAHELEQSFLQTDPISAAQFGNAIFNSDWRPELSKVSSECLVVQSEHDPVVPLEVGRYLTSHIHNCKLKTIAMEGHFPHLSAPDRLVKSIRQFVGVTPQVRDKGVGLGKAPRQPKWPADKPAEVRFSLGAWSRRLTPQTDEQGRADLEELLLRRVGELSAHLGRYDMYALAITGWFGEPTVTSPVNVRTRGAVIKTLLARTGAAPGVIAQFDAINADLTDVLDRHEIAAKNCAVVPAFKLAMTPSLPANPRDWYEYESASDQELIFFIEAIERDILSVASLYIRLSNFATVLRGP